MKHQWFVHNYELMLAMVALLLAATEGFLLHATETSLLSVVLSSSSAQEGDKLYLCDDHDRAIALPYKDDPPRRRTILNAAALAFSTLTVATFPSRAASPANNNNNNKDISGMDFSGQDLSNKDFSKMIARKTKLRNCNLQGSSFVQADLTGADFSGSNLQGASFVDATLDGSTFANAQAQKTRFSKTILDIADAENVDLTDSMWPSSLRIMICDMHEIRGMNPVTGVDSKESLFCTDINYKS